MRANNHGSWMEHPLSECCGIYKRSGKMEKHTFSIPNISCGHCVMSIKNELSEIEGIKAVEGDPASKTITVEWETPATLEDIRTTLKNINYPAS